MAATSSVRVAATVRATTPWQNPVGRASPFDFKHTLGSVSRPKVFFSSSSPTFTPTSSTSSPPLPRFSYHIAASFSGKDSVYDPSHHVHHFNDHNLAQEPRRRLRLSARPDSGHDAYFASCIRNTGSVAFGIADGVGGWVNSGVNPADFSFALCDHMAAWAHSHRTSKHGRLTPRRLMQEGYHIVCGDRSLLAGGSTACVGIVSPDGTFEVANLGDSGWLHLRLNAINAYSEPQTQGFRPFQLSLLPQKLIAKMALYGGGHLCNFPPDADVSQHCMRHGDILLFATDGVLDNLFRHEILKIASRAMLSTGAWQKTPSGSVCVGDTIDALTRPPGSTSKTSEPGGDKTSTKAVTLQSMLATEIVGAAKAASLNTKVDGPFAKKVRKYYPDDPWHGGKPDDICVMVAVVLEDSRDAERKAR